MAYRCELCDKKNRAGRQHKHHPGVAGAQWKRRAQTTNRMFKANLHWVSLPVAGVMTRMHACTDCISRIKFDAKKAAAAVTPPIVTA